MIHILRPATALPLAAAALAGAWSAAPAAAQGAGHGHGAEGGSLDALDVAAGLVHGAALGGAVLLAGIIAFVALVWLPSHRVSGSAPGSVVVFWRCVWALFGLLVAAGMAEVSLYAVRASGETFGPARLAQALYETRVGQTWLAQLGFALVACLFAARAARGRDGLWWAALASSAGVLVTVTQLGHAATGGGALPFVADWLHVAAAGLWMGGLLGFPLILLWPARKLEAGARAQLLAGAVRRFSRVASGAVVVLIATGIYAILLQVPSAEAVFSTPYGRALVMKLGLLAFLLPIGLINMVDRGKEPFGRMVGAELLLALGIFIATGFLTSLPPP